MVRCLYVQIWYCYLSILFILIAALKDLTLVLLKEPDDISMISLRAQVLISLNRHSEAEAVMFLVFCAFGILFRVMCRRVV